MENKFDEESFTVSGLPDDVNPYIEKMIKYWRKTRKNLYSFLLTLDINDLLNISNELVKECLENDEFEMKGKYSNIGRHLAILAFSIEKGKDTGTFTADVKDFVKAVRAFSIMTGFAHTEKLGDIKIIDESYFFDPCIDLKIKILNEKLLEELRV